jgi:hypothetical protein
MAEITLPRWIITQKCMPHGVRLSKKPVLPPEIVEVSKGHKVLRVITDAFKSHGFIPNEKPGIFESWEYRFWAADLTDPTDLLAECRCCSSVFGNEIGRKLHLGNNGCAKKLTAAYKLLLKDKICVVCDQKTHGKQKWGVPICGPVCQQVWCESQAQPNALTAALKLVGDNV